VTDAVLEVRPARVSATAAETAGQAGRCPATHRRGQARFSYLSRIDVPVSRWLSGTMVSGLSRNAERAKNVAHVGENAHSEPGEAGELSWRSRARGSRVRFSWLSSESRWANM